LSPVNEPPPGLAGGGPSGQQLQVLQVQGLQWQPPLVQLQVQAESVFSVFSIVVFPFGRGVDSHPVKAL
jgi:hypothetical protein